MERESVVFDVQAVLDPRVQDSFGATVSGLKPDTEGDVIGREQWKAIHERHAAGANISALSREFDLDRKTVRACLRQSAWAPYRREKGVVTVLDAHRTWLVERAPQVNYSARILYQELRAQRGFTGSYETVKLAVRPLRAEAWLAGLTQRRFETAPGEQAQVDWGQVSVRIGEQRAKVHIFVMTLGYSRRGYAEGFMNERMAELLAAHERAFAHFGGRCECLLYDRMRTVVLGTLASDDGQRRPRWNTTFSAFADHWGFTPRLCQPYRAQTKGKVESGVKYVKRNFVPGRSFVDLEDFNQQLMRWQVEIADVRIHGTTHQRPIDRFAEEAAALVPTAGQSSFLQAMVRSRVVGEDWLVTIDANRYSVPFGLIGQTVEVVRVGGSWQIRYRGRLVAEHAVLAGRAQLSVCPEHGPGAAMRNARQRHAGPAASARGGDGLRPMPDELAVEVRDLALYDSLLHTSSAHERQEVA